MGLGLSIDVVGDIFFKETVRFVIASNISTLSPPLQSDKQQRGEARRGWQSGNICPLVHQ